MLNALSSRQKLAAALATAVAFCMADAVWLGYLSVGFYQETIGPIMLTSPRWSAAIAFYVIYLLGTLWFVVWPTAARGIGATALQGALFGLVAYATFDLTGLAVLQPFTWKLAFIDIAWGMFATALAAAVGAAAARLTARRQRP